MNEDSEDECVEFVGFTLNEDHDGNFDNDSALDLDDNANGNVDDTQSADTTSTTTKTKKKTNRYAAQMKSKTNLTSNARLNTWYDTDTKEIKTFLGMTIGMGLVQQMSLNDYWSTDKILSTPFFPTIMPRNRFLGILNCLHLNNNEKHVARDHTEYDPIFKLRPVYDVMQTKFRESYTPTESIALNEATIGWRGNLSFKVYNPDKPTRFGIKLYEICDSSNGYCCNFEMYMGRNKTISENGATYDLVMRLMTPYLNKGYKLYTDNYYSSPILFNDLLQKKLVPAVHLE